MKLKEDEQYEFQYMEGDMYVYKISYPCDDEWYYVTDFNGEHQLIYSYEKL